MRCSIGAAVFQPWAKRADWFERVKCEEQSSLKEGAHLVSLIIASQILKLLYLTSTTQAKSFSQCCYILEKQQVFYLPCRLVMFDLPLLLEVDARQMVFE